MYESDGCVAGSDSSCFSPAKGSHTAILLDDLTKRLRRLEESNSLVKVVEVFANGVAHPVREASLDCGVLPVLLASLSQTTNPFGRVAATLARFPALKQTCRV